jgi:UDP-N-acetylmuramoyl-tripeptide--D-alanyl-D-alanine ligase
VEGLTWHEIGYGLQQSHTQLRMVAVRTEIGALLLDDTYNASPESTLAALNLLNDLQGRRIAVLGDMLELGPYEKEGHELVGLRAAQVCAQLIAVGEKGKMIAEAAVQGGMHTNRVLWAATVSEALEFLRTLLREDDIVLIKGSHGLRMDRIVTELEAVNA